ncbi:exonuclease [Marimonas sp. MJW-29]|uniref:Exonuclease n=1 Tax=Sulfitobacter sediminis TaxID=3234186 RepID=A0ABV3RH33_9RHOB
MDHVVVYDCEFLTAPGAPMRFWCGPRDPDPLCVQIGAVRLSLKPPFDVSEAQGWFVEPRDRDGKIVPVDPLLTRLTGIDDALLAREAVPLVEALEALDRFADGGLLMSWGTDDVLTLSTSLYVQGVLSPIPARRFRSAVPLLVTAGEPEETVLKLRSNTICDHFGLEAPGDAHDARADATGVACVLAHLLAMGRLTAKDIRGLAPTPT